MKFFLWIVLLYTNIFIFSCNKNSSPENRIYFVQSKGDYIDTSTKNRIYLSTSFWQYFFNKYPASSLILFLNTYPITNSAEYKNRDNCFKPAYTLDMRRLENLLPSDASLTENVVRFPLFSFFVVANDSTKKEKITYVSPKLTSQISNDYKLFKKMLFDTGYNYQLYYMKIIGDSILYWINTNNIKRENTSSGK